MKVLHIVGDSDSGGSAVVSQLAQMARQFGLQVDVLTRSQELARTLRAGEFGVVELDFRGVFGVRRLYRFLRGAGYEIVHAHSSRLACLAARLAGTPAILHTTGCFAFHEGSHPPVQWFRVLLEKLAARWSNRIVTTSAFHRRRALWLGIADERKLRSIPYGIPERCLRTGRERLDLRSNLGADRDELLLLVMGRLGPDNGIEYLIDATPGLAARLNRPFSFLVAGDGPVPAALEQRARDRGVADRFSFLGFREDMDELLAACDIVVLPSLGEKPSMELLEAMASAKPVIATSTGSNREVTRGNKAALLVPPANSVALADAICTLAADPGRAARIGRRARKIFLASYTETLMISRYRDEYFLLMEAASDGGREHAEPQNVKRKVADALVRAASKFVSSP